MGSLPTIKQPNDITNDIKKKEDNTVSDLTILTVPNDIKKNTVSEGITHRNLSTNDTNSILKNKKAEIDFSNSGLKQ